MTFPPQQTHWKERYAALRADNRCVTCTGKILPEWPQTSRCPECTEKRKPAVHKYVHSAKYRRVKKAYRAREDVRQRDRKHKREQALRKKLEGECKDCRQPALDDAMYCARHQELHRAANRDYSRRQREAKRSGRPLERKPMGPKKKPWAKSRGPRILKLRPIKPVFKETPPPSMDPVHDYRLGDIDLAEAARRLVELHNGITAQEVGDLLGASKKERNAVSTALRRALALGRVDVEGNGMDRVFYPLRQSRRAA